MLNLILDTNAWIYLANGFNSKNNKYEEETHFQIVKWMLQKIKYSTCRVFSNSIIKLEWERNKKHANQLIIQYENELNQKTNELKNKRNCQNYKDLAKQFSEFKSAVNIKITKNKEHVNMVEEILANSIEIPIEDKHKVKASNLAIDRKPPFHHKNNSIADAVIFLSTVDYFYYDEDFCIDDTIFISNNTSDFSESATNKELHPELAKMLKDKPIIFKTNLAEALEMGEDIIVRYQKYLDYLNRDVIECLMDCNGKEYSMAEVEFTEHIKVEISEEIDKEGYTYNPNQLIMDLGEDYKFTVDELKAMESRKFITVKKGEFITIDLGTCNFCNATHLRCECGEEHATYGEDIECGCGKHFLLEDEIKVIEKNKTEQNEE